MNIIIGVIFALVLGTFLDRLYDWFWKAGSRRNGGALGNLERIKSSVRTSGYIGQSEKGSWKSKGEKKPRKIINFL